MDIKSIVKNKFPHIFKLLKSIQTVYLNYKYRQRLCSFGEMNPDKTIYVIRMSYPHVGLMSYYTSVLGHIKNALNHGYIPVVDMKNYKSPYINAKDLGKINAWELYFKQPTEMTLDEAYKSKNVILCYATQAPIESAPRRLYQLLKNDESYYSIVKDYMNFNYEIEEYTKEQKQKVFNVDGKILGVSSRGTDMINFPRHSKLLTREELLKNVISLMEKLKYDYVFLSTEENQTVEYFKEQLGNKLLVDARQRYDGYDKSGKKVLTEIKFDRANDEFLQGKEYLNTVYLLSQCDSLYGPLIGSTMGALCMNLNKYEYVGIYDNGTYQ